MDLLEELYFFKFFRVDDEWRAIDFISLGKNEFLVSLEKKNPLVKHFLFSKDHIYIYILEELAMREFWNQFNR